MVQHKSSNKELNTYFWAYQFQMSDSLNLSTYNVFFLILIVTTVSDYLSHHFI